MMDTTLPIISIRSGIGENSQCILSGRRMHTVADEHSFFYGIDWFMMTLRLLMKDYLFLADHLVPIGDQIGMSRDELADMLRTKTRRFTEEDIKNKFK